MILGRAFSKLGLVVGLSAATGLLVSCGGDAADSESASVETASATRSPGGREVARADFVLCPAIESIAADLAGIVGFQLDEDRGVQAMVGECFVRGEESEFVSVALAPAIMSSVGMQASGYEGSQAAVPAFGEDAVMIRDPVQPHLIFELLGQIIDVGVEGPAGTTPDTGTVIRVATAARDALLAANGG